ncbi:iron-sulfur cluster protein ISCA [Cardiosporidium cionae]|uniref:Iron-sulfur cluster protein ISCA n=1 Tax=Cardiosporidium cionae TaxID=476202 RepID=A0ABQ7J5V3_9APIC|nr:iron-sulfur cluster protein ISCA [Cardiosporidium cionae]|eukprot:KAF8819070.1 iron-sulfur cluster protein ISCA [Cardiosporidium cionae]
MQRLYKVFSTAVYFGNNGGFFRHMEELPFSASIAYCTSFPYVSCHPSNFIAPRFKALQASVIEMQKIESTFRLSHLLHPLESTILSPSEWKVEPLAKRFVPLSQKGVKTDHLSYGTHLSCFSKTPTLMALSENSGSFPYLSNNFLHVQQFPASSLSEISNTQENTNASLNITGLEKNLDKQTWKRTKRLSNISTNIISLTDNAVKRIREILDQRGIQRSSPSPELASELSSAQKLLKEVHDERTALPISETKGKQRVITDGVRISLKRQGCNGLSYKMTYADESPLHELDEVIEDKGVTLVIDYKAVMYLVGTQMDFVETEISREFVFHNPNKKTECGCGKSFSV